MKNIFLFIALCFIITSTIAQSKKDLVNNKISAETTNITVTSDDGKEITYKDSYTLYDKDGKVIEQTEYAKDGTIKRKEVNKYDSQKNKIEESVFEAKTKAIIKTTYTYNSSNDKTGEIEYDASGKIAKQSEFIYDNKGFKTEKKTYDGNKKLISVKKYTYTARK